MEPGSSARDAVATEDASSESWDTVHLTPLTAEKELTHIAVSCSFVLHSTGGYSVAPPTTSLHTVAPSASTGTAATLPEGLPASVNVEGSGSVTLPSYTDAAGQRAAKETEGATAPSADAAAAAGSTRGLAEVYGAYRGVRIIHNVAPCLVRCAAEVGLPSSSTLGRPNTSNTLGSVSVGYGSLPAVTATAASAPPTAQPAFSPSPSFPPQSPQSTEAGTNSQVQSSAQSTLDSSAPQGSPLAPPQQPSFTTTKAATAAPPTAAQSSTSQQLQQLTSAYARSAMRRSSKASSRRSHTSSSSLPESVVFLDPLEIIADAAISFEDIVFATHVSVRGKGPVHFINCCFGPSSTPQLSQQFVSAPVSAEGDGRRQTYLQVVPAADAVQSTEHGTGLGSSSEVPDRPSGWATTAAATKAPTVSGTVPTDATQPVGHDDNEDNKNSNTPARSAPLHAPCDSSSGVFGLLTGFALPTAMQVLRARRRGFLSSAVPAGMADPLSRSSPQQQQQQQSGATTSCCTLLKDGQTTCPTMTAFHDSEGASVVDVYGGAVCELNQCDLYGGSAGASLVCREHSRVTVTDSSFDGPSITWAAIEVRDAAAATVQFTNIQQVIGVGILVVDRGSATVDSSVIERCGTAGVVVTDNGTLSLFNTGVEASASGVCVSLSGSAEAKMVGCGFTTRFPLPRRAAGLMFVKHLQTIGAFRSSRCTGPTSPAQDSLASTNDDPLLQHVLNADLESLLGLWLLWIGDADTAFPTSSQSVVLSDHAVAGVTECEFTSTMRLPGSSVSSATASTAQNIADTTAMEETPSSSHSRANRSEGAVPSFTGLPPAAASAIAVMLSGSEANLSGTNSRGMSSSGHNLVHNTAASAGNAFLLPGSSATRRHPAGSEETGRRDGFPYVARKSVTTFSDSIDRVDSEEAMPLPSGLVRHASRSSTIPVAAFVDAASEKAGERGGRAQLSGAGTPAASTAGGPPPLHATAATAAAATAAAGTLSTTSGSPLLPLPVRNVVAGLLSSYVMAWEVFGAYLGQRRRAHASARPPTTAAAATTRTSSSSSLVVETPKAGPESKPTWRSSGGGGGEEERTFTDLFLTFEAPTEINNGGGAEEGTSAMRLSPTTHSAGPDGDNAGAAGRRLGLLSAAAMQSLQGSLQQLGCLTVLMAPNGGVYHIVASQQASLALTSSVLSLALPPQLMVTMPSSWASAAGCYYVGGTAAFSSTIRTTAAPFVAAVLDYHEPEKVSAAGHSSAAASPSRGGTAREGGGRERKAGQLQRQHKEHQSGGAPFCSIFTRSNVIRYECVSLATAQSKAEQTSRPSTKTTATGGSVQRQEGGQGEGTRETANIALATPTTATVAAAASGSTNGRPAQRGSMGLDEEDLAEAGESSTVHSIFGAGVSGYSYNNSIRRRGVGADNDTPKPAGVARNSAQLPPRPASASASAAQHPHQQQQQQQPLADDCDNHTSTSSSAVDFNTAAWGLVLVTPPATRHSEALEAAVRMQAEHWCRVEITPSQAPSINRVGSSATSSTAVPDTGREGPLEVPTPLRRNSASPAAAVSPSSRGTSASTRTAGGSASVGRGSALGDGAQLDSVDVTETSEAGRSGGAREASEMPDTQGSQVHHLGNIFLNMTNQAELLSVTHPEHICTAFSNFARVMELPAAQEYPTTPSAGTSPLLFKQTPSLGGGGAAAAATNATAGTTAGGAGATVGPTLEDRDAPPLPAHRAHLDAGRVGAAATTTALPSATTGTAAATTTTTTISGYSSPTATAPYNTFPSLHTGEREVSRLHVNADLQRQMLLGDVDAPPLYAAAAVAAAVRDASEDVGGCASRVYDVSQAAMSSMLRSVDRTKIGGNNQSSTSTRPSNRSTPSPERMHAGVAAMAAAAREEEERVRLLAATKAGAQQVQSFSMPGSALSSRVASQHRNPSFPTSPLAPAAAAAAAAVMQAPANTGPVIPPSPPQISILDVVSEASWSNSTDSSSNGSESDSDDSGSVSRRSSNSSGGGSEGSGRRRSRGAQLEVRSKWAFKLRKSSSSTHHSFRPNNAADGVHGDARHGVLESGKAAERSQTSSDTNADLMHVAADGESAVSTSESSVGNASDERRAEAEAVARSEAEQQARRRVSPRPPSLFPPLPSLPAAQAPPSPQLATAAASPVVSLPQLSHVTNHPLPDSEPAPFAPEPLLSERRAHNDTPLLDRAATAATAAASASSTASSKPRTVSSSSQSSKAGRADSEQHQPSRHSVTHAMGSPPLSSSDSSRRSSPVVAPTRPGSHQRRSGATAEEERQQREHRGGSRATSSVAPTVAAPRAAAAAAAAAAAVGVAQSDATLERVAQLEEQLLLLQRSMLLHQTRMAQMQCAFQHSTSSQTESSAMENQPSLLALPPNLKTFADGSDHTNGNSKDSRRTQSSSYPSSFSASKIQSASTSHAAADAPAPETTAAQPAPQAMLPLPLPAAHGEVAQRETATRPPVSPSTEERHHAAPDAVASEEASTTAAAVREVDEEKDVHITQAPSQNVSDTNAANVNAAPLPSIDAHASQHQSPSPPPAAAAAAAPAPVARSKTMLAPAPPLTSPPGSLQSPPQRPRPRHPSASTTLQLLLAAAQSSLFGSTTSSSASAPTTSVDGTSMGGDNSTSWNAPQHHRYLVGDALDDVGDEDRRWEEALLRRLRSAHYGDGSELRGSGERWRERFPPSGPHVAGSKGRRPDSAGAYPQQQPQYPHPSQQQRRRHSETVELWGAGVGPGTETGYVDGAGEAEHRQHSHRPPGDEPHPPQLGTPGASFEPWRTTVATGTRYAHQPPPHPYAFPPPPPQPHPAMAAEASDFAADDDADQPPRRREMRLPIPLPTPPLSASSVTSSRRPLRPSSCPVPPPPYIELASSSQLTAAGLLSPLPVPPQALYLSGRRRSHQRPPPPRQQQQQQQQQQASINRPPYASTASLASPSALIAHLHEDHLHDQYARAAWNAVVAQSQQQQRERQRLTSPLQSAQVHRLYAEPMRDRAERAAAHAQPTPQQLYRLHGCTFTPKINDSRTASRRPPSRQRTGSRSGARPLHNADLSIDSLHAPLAQTSNTSTVISENAGMSTNAQNTSGNPRRGMPRR